MTLKSGRTAVLLLCASALAGCSTYAAPGSSPEPLRPNFPTRVQDQPAPAPAAAPVQAPPPIAPPPVVQAPPAQVESSELPPISGAGVPEPNYAPPPVTQRPPAASSPAAPAWTPPAAAPAPAAPARSQPVPAQPAFRTVTRTIVNGKVVDADGPASTITVQKGDSLYAIGRRLKISPEELARLNGLKEPYRLQPGDELKGPRSNAKAYVVSEGDTLSAISRRFGVTVNQIAEANEMSTSDNLKIGRRIILPEGFKDRGPIKIEVRTPIEPAEGRLVEPEPARPAPPPRPAPAPAPRPVPAPAPAPRPAPPPTVPSYPVQQPPAAPQAAPVTPQPAPATPARLAPRPEPRVEPRPEPQRPATPPPAPAARPEPAPVPAPPAQPRPQPQIVPSSPSPADLQISQLGRGRFAWPLRGDIISGFGPKGTGQRNDGVNIRINAGAPVRAAAAGDVVYAGDQVPGFGNLVLIKHADGWVTAYGHLGRVDVKMQQKVTQGQQIGQAGASGGVSEPQLHFEVRYAPTPADRARPIDPLLVLPK